MLKSIAVRQKHCKDIYIFQKTNKRNKKEEKYNVNLLRYNEINTLPLLHYSNKYKYFLSVVQ